MASNVSSMDLRSSGASSPPRRRRRLRSPGPSEYGEDGVEIFGAFEGELGQGSHENASCDGLLGRRGDMGNLEEGTCGDSFGGMEKSMGDLDLFSCPICMEPWSSGDAHRICCLPCGHLFGHSCIETWIQRCGKSDGKCPQCNKKCKVKDITKLYAPRIATADGDCKQQVVALQVENESLKLQAQRLSEKIDRHRIQMLEKKQLHEALMQSQRTVYEATISDLQDRITHMQLAHEELRQSKEAKLIAEIDDLSSRLMEMKKTAAMGSQASLKKLEMVEKEGRQWTSGERNVSRNKGREKTNLAEEMDYVFDPEPPQPQLPRPPISYKNLLQQEFQRLGQTLPTYVISDCGSPRRRIFKATVSHRGHDFIGALAYTRKAAEQSAAREAYVYISNHGPDPSTEERLKEANLLVEALRCQLQEKSEELASEKFISNYQEAEISRLRSELSVMGTQLEAVTAATKDLTAHLARVMALERAPEARNSSYISAGGSNHTMAE